MNYTPLARNNFDSRQQILTISDRNGNKESNNKMMVYYFIIRSNLPNASALHQSIADIHL